MNMIMSVAADRRSGGREGDGGCVMTSGRRNRRLQQSLIVVIQHTETQRRAA